MAGRPPKIASVGDGADVLVKVEDTAPILKKPTEVKETNKTINDTDMIVCVSQIPNVSYKHQKTGDMYTWKNIGDTEEIEFAVLKDMRRNSSSYIKDLWITFNDKEVIKFFKLEKVYASYFKLMEVGTYTKDNIEAIKELLVDLPTGLTNTVVSKVKAIVSNGDVSDVKVIRELEKIFDIDLISMIR